jgi:hypothetical protein
MRIIKNAKALSKLSLILLLIVSGVVGALLSYLGVVGYYESLEYRNPETPSITISNASFDPRNTTYFNATFLYPTYSTSREPATVAKIAVSTSDGILHNVMTVRPSLPQEFAKGESRALECFWNWANYTGETVEISTIVENGSGAAAQFETPLVSLQITDVSFNSTISVSRLNLTVQNSESSVTHVNVTRITIDTENITALAPNTLPYTLNPSDSVQFPCSWDWAGYQGQNITVAVHTLQGYTAYYPEPPKHTTLPSPVVLDITDVLFDVSDTTFLNLTVTNSEASPTYATLSNITVTVENETFPEIPVMSPPALPYRLAPGGRVTVKCSWDWTNYREKNATITINTLQGLRTSTTQSSTPRVVLTITEAQFIITDTSHFNITIENSEFSLDEFANITRISVEDVGEDLTVEPPPSLDYALYVNDSVTFKCNWDWTSHWYENATITVHSLQGYTASRTEVVPAPIFIAEATFNATDTAHCNITLENHEQSQSYVIVTSATVTLENGTTQPLLDVGPASLPYVIHPGEAVTFECLWNWADYHGKEVTITVHTSEGHEAFLKRMTP